MNQYELSTHFVEGLSSKNKAAGSMFSDYNNTRLYSFGYHFTIAIRDDKRKLYIINGDRYSQRTSKHQSEFRGALVGHRKNGYRDITIPFSVMQQAGVDIDTIDPVDVEPDTEIAICKTHDVSFTADQFELAWSKLQSHVASNGTLENGIYTRHCETHYEHHLGGSVFRGRMRIMSSIRGKMSGGYVYFLSGFDETHNSRTDGYFVSQLPFEAKSVAHAFEMLKPVAVKIAIKNGLDVKRQGDAFAIPVDSIPKKSNISRAHKEPKMGYAYFNKETGAICHEYYHRDECEYIYREIGKEIDVPLFPHIPSHGANTVALAPDGKVYAKGNIYHRPQFRHPEHKIVKLGDVWHRIVKNTAVMSWGSESRVD